MVFVEGSEKGVHDLSNEPSAPEREEVPAVAADVDASQEPLETTHRFPTGPVQVSSRAGRVILSTRPLAAPAAADGATGNNGQRGSSGANGSSGRPGGNGANGMDGSHGGHGTDGAAGRAGANADDVSVQLSGTPQMLHVRYNRSRAVYQTRGITVCADGGDGGDGGNGGPGGHGGRGGNGGKGGRGKDAYGKISPGAGGAGGNGGNGGCGGRGGNGGAGGPGGNAGNVVIETADAALLMLVDVAAQGGRPGRGGTGGARGKGGAAGSSGSGGRGGANSGNRAADGRGTDGNSGSSGQSGDDGNDGEDGTDGRRGEDGMITYVISSSDGASRLETGAVRYTAKVECCEVAAVVDDGIFEPGEPLCITGVRVKNTGELTLPPGVVVSLSGVKNFTPAPREHSSYRLEQSLPPGESVAIPFSFRGQIGPATGVTEFQIRTTLLDIGFGAEHYLERRIEPVQYPVKLASLQKRYQAPSGRYVVPLLVENLSSFSYGGEGDGGHVEYAVTLSSDAFSFAPSESESAIGEKTRVSTVSVVAARESFAAEISLDVSPSAAFYELLHFTVALSLRGREIERHEAAIQVVPLFNPEQAEHASALFITNSATSRETFASFVTAFSRLSLSLCVWDSDLYNGVSIDRHTGVRHSNSWVDLFQGKLVVFLCKEYGGLGDLLAIDLASHFAVVGDQTATAEEVVPFSSSFLLLGPVPAPKLMAHIADASLLVRKLVHGEFSDWFTFTKPSRKYMEEKCVAIQKELETENAGVCFSVVGTYAPGILKKTWTSQQITYGTAEVRRLPVTKTDKLHCSTLQQVGSSDEQVLTMVIDALPLLHKLRLVADMGSAPAAGPVSESDRELVTSLVRATLFQQLKREFFLHGEELATLDQLVNLLHLERERLLVPVVVELAFLLVESLKKATYWASFKLLHSQRNKKHLMLSRYSDLLEKMVTFATPSPSVSPSASASAPALIPPSSLSPSPSPSVAAHAQPEMPSPSFIGRAATSLIGRSLITRNSGFFSPVEEAPDPLDLATKSGFWSGSKKAGWKRDSQHNVCASCLTPFKLHIRKHHCRSCGEIFCSECSSHRMRLPHKGYKKRVRVCVRCFVKFMEVVQGQSLADNFLQYHRTPKNSYKCIIVGPMGSGKTALVQRLVLGKSGLRKGEALPSTLGSTTWSYDVTLDDGTRVPFHLWDISGNERYHSMLSSYASEADVCIVTYDVSSDEPLSTLKSPWIKLTRELDRTETVVALVGLKSDLENRDITKKDGTMYAKMQAMDFHMEVSPWHGTGVKDLISKVTDMLLAKNVRPKVLVVEDDSEDELPTFEAAM